MFPSRYFAPRYFAPRYFTSAVAPPGAGVALIIDGLNETDRLRWNSVRWDDRLEQRTNLGFVLVDQTSPPYYRPAVGQPVRLFVDGREIFSGSIDKFIDDEPIKNKGIFYTVKCVSLDQILDRFLVFKTYENIDADEIVKDIIENFVPASEAMTTNGVLPAFTLGKIVFGYRTVTQCLDELSDLTGFSWFVDEDRDLQFFAPGQFMSGFNIRDLPTGAPTFNYRKLRIDRSRTKYRNKQYIRAGLDTTDLQTENFAGDGERQTFTLGFEVSDDATPIITLDTGGGPVVQTVGIRGIDDDASFDWYYRTTEKEITQKSADTAIASTDILQVQYFGLFPIVVLRTLPSEIASRSAVEGGSGIYENVIDDNSIESGDFAEEKGDGLLRRFGEIPTKLIFETDVDGLRAGQCMGVQLQNRGADVDRFLYLIDSVKGVDVDALIMRYQIRALSGEHLGGWARFWRKLKEAGRVFNLREGETLQILNQADEILEIDEVFNQVDALEDEDDDTLTCWHWEFATWGRSCWGPPPV